MLKKTAQTVNCKVHRTADCEALWTINQTCRAKNAIMKSMVSMEWIKIKVRLLKLCLLKLSSLGIHVVFVKRKIVMWPCHIIYVSIETYRPTETDVGSKFCMRVGFLRDPPILARPFPGQYSCTGAICLSFRSHEQSAQCPMLTYTTAWSTCSQALVV